MKNNVLAALETVYMFIMGIIEFFAVVFLIFGLFIFALVFGISMKIANSVLALVRK